MEGNTADSETSQWFDQQHDVLSPNQCSRSSTTLPAVPQSASESPVYRTSAMAWVALFFLVVLRASIAIFQNTFNPIPNVVATYLGVNLTAINWLFNVTTVVYIIVSFGTGWLFETIGVKKSLILAGALTAGGCWIRWVAVRIHPPSYPVMMIGQTIASIGCPLSLNIMTKFAAVWFTEDRRATAGMFVASNYGSIVAMFLMPAVATGADRIEFTVIMVAVIATVAMIPQFFLPAGPRTPTSPIEMKLDHPPQSVFKSTMTLMKNVNFWIVCGINGTNVGLSVAWGGLSNQAFAPYGYTDAQAGTIQAVATIAGTLGSLVAGPTLDATRKHKLFLKLFAPVMCSTYVAFVFIIGHDAFAAILYVSILNQFFLSFMVPTAIELAVEATYPIPEAISTSIMWQIGNLVGFILVSVMDKFRDPTGDPPNNMFRGLVFQASLSGICVLLCLIYNGPMLRMEAYRVNAALEANSLPRRESAETLHVVAAEEKEDGTKDKDSAGQYA